MGVTAITGPQVVFGITLSSTGGVQEYNEERGPSVFDLGQGVADPRPPYNYDPGNPVGTPILSLYNGMGLVDAVPAASNSSLNYVPGTIVSCLTGSSALTSVTLNTSTVSGNTYSQSVFDPTTGGTFTANIAVDYATPWLTFGSAGTIAAWNPANGIARCIAITGSSSGVDDSNVTAQIAGRDVYGYPVSETVTLGASSLNGALSQKAFKYLTSITLVNSSLITSSHINIGWADKFGFPTIVTGPMYATVMEVSSNSSTAVTYSASQGITFGATATPTATTADVRGTWTSTGASVNFNGNNRLQIRTTLNPVLVDTVTASDTSGLFGNTQYST